MSKKKKTVLLYDDFSNYEFSVMLSIFRLINPIQHSV